VANAIHVIVPYRHASTWVFDDPRVGLSQEPFVSGIPEMIDTMVANIPNAEKGFRWADNGEGWLCPALFLYFPEAPTHLYAKAEAL
jgi:hypothetical protein